MVQTQTVPKPPVQSDRPAPSGAARKVLFLAQLPPPLHGASAMSKRVHDIMTARADLDLTHVWFGGAASNQDVGRRSLGKFLVFIRFVASLLWQFIAGRRYAIGYLTLAPFAHAALRDGVLIALSKLLARRTIVHLHALGIGSVMAGNTLSQRILRRLIGGVELITITKNDWVTLSATRHFKAVHLLANGIEDPGKPALTPSTTLRCGYLANLDPRKGVLRFLDCIEALRRDGLTVTGRIAGDQTTNLSFAELEAQIARRGLDHIVEAAGPLYGDQKTELFATTDLFIYLSSHDYFPLVVIEAMASGAVPVIFDIEGQRELVGPPFAANVLAPDLAPTALTATVAAVVRHYHEDRAILARDRAAARARYQDCYTTERFAGGFNAILDASSQSK